MNTLSTIIDYLIFKALLYSNAPSSLPTIPEAYMIINIIEQQLFLKKGNDQQM